MDAGELHESIQATIDRILDHTKYKARSQDTSQNVHIPLLLANPDLAPTVVLVGDSTLERMITTGQTPNLVAPWPSPAMLDDETLAAVCPNHPTRLDRVFNAGVGGDKIQNVLYRMAGDPGKELPGLLTVLLEKLSVKLWVLHMGTNNLTPKKGLTVADVQALEEFLSSLFYARYVRRGEGIAPELDYRVLVTGIFYRKDVPTEYVDASNERLQEVVRKFQGQGDVGKERIAFLPATDEIKIGDHLDDHVHFNLEGYKLWAKKLFPVMVGMLSPSSTWRVNTGDQGTEGLVN